MLEFLLQHVFERAGLLVFDYTLCLVVVGDEGGSLKPEDRGCFEFVHKVSPLFVFFFLFFSLFSLSHYLF